MKKLIVKGGYNLSGQVNIQGAKNAAQKIIPATVIFPGKYQLNNIPTIRDVNSLVDVLKFLGAAVRFKGKSLLIDTETIFVKELPPEITVKSTGSFLFAGALLSRFGKVKIWHPGGDKIGKRPVTWHLNAFKKLGANIYEEKEYYEVTAKKLYGAVINFERKTVNGTVNAILAAVKADGMSILKNVALEPEIDNFISFINDAGADVFRNDANEIIINGVGDRSGTCTIDIIPDRNDAATFLIAIAITKGSATLTNVCIDHLKPLISELEKLNVVFFCDTVNNTLSVNCKNLTSYNLHITSKPFPFFSTDWGPMFQTLMTQIPGNHSFHETIFSSRFNQLKYLSDMGANITYYCPNVDNSVYNFSVKDQRQLHAVRIVGGTILKGKSVIANDVRAGAALALAGLVAKGITEISGVEQIDRGYENFSERLKSLGACIALNK